MKATIASGPEPAHHIVASPEGAVTEIDLRLVALDVAMGLDRAYSSADAILSDADQVLAWLRGAPRDASRQN